MNTVILYNPTEEQVKKLNQAKLVHAAMVLDQDLTMYTEEQLKLARAYMYIFVKMSPLHGVAECVERTMTRTEYFETLFNKHVML